MAKQALSPRVSAMPTSDELHRNAYQLMREGHHAVFNRLPHLISRIIQTKAWKARSKEFKNFGEYALDQTSEGLGIENNQKLWLLRCAMDVTGEHQVQWGDVLAQVEKMVRLYAKEEKVPMRKFDGNSLETLGKLSTDQSTEGKITYLPSLNKNVDGHLMRLRTKDYATYRKVVSGQMSLVEARKAIGDRTSNHTNLGRGQSAFRMMTSKERRAFIEWLKSEGAL